MRAELYDFNMVFIEAIEIPKFRDAIDVIHHPPLDVEAYIGDELTPMNTTVTKKTFVWKDRYRWVMLK